MAPATGFLPSTFLEYSAMAFFWINSYCFSDSFIIWLYKGDVLDSSINIFAAECSIVISPCSPKSFFVSTLGVKLFSFRVGPVIFKSTFLRLLLAIIYACATVSSFLAFENTSSCSQGWTSYLLKPSGGDVELYTLFFGNIFSAGMF